MNSWYQDDNCLFPTETYLIIIHYSHSFQGHQTTVKKNNNNINIHHYLVSHSLNFRDTMHILFIDSWEIYFKITAARKHSGKFAKDKNTIRYQWHIYILKFSGISNFNLLINFPKTQEWCFKIIPELQFFLTFLQNVNFPMSQ